MVVGGASPQTPYRVPAIEAVVTPLGPLVTVPPALSQAPRLLAVIVPVLTSVPTPIPPAPNVTPSPPATVPELVTVPPASSHAPRFPPVIVAELTTVPTAPKITTAS